jgi:hypothetical protein
MVLAYRSHHSKGHIERADCRVDHTRQREYPDYFAQHSFTSLMTAWPQTGHIHFIIRVFVPLSRILS